MDELKCWNFWILEIQRTYDFHIGAGLYFKPELRPWITLGPFELRLILSKNRCD